MIVKQVRIEDKRTNSHDVDAIQQRTEIKAKHTMEYNKAVLMNLDPLSITLNEPLWTSNTSQMYMGKIKEHSALIRKLSQVSSSDATHRLKEAVFSFENINHDNLV